MQNTHCIQCHECMRVPSSYKRTLITGSQPVISQSSAHRQDTGEGSWPLSYVAVCTEPEQCFHSNVREGQGLTIGKTPTRTHTHRASEMSSKNEPRQRAPLSFRVKNRRRLKENNAFIQTDLRTREAETRLGARTVS